MQSSIPIVKLERLAVFSCGDCDKLYPTAEGLADHSKWHDLQEYLNEEGVLDHFKSAFVKLQRVFIFQCGVCPVAFVDIRQFQDHQANAHKKQKTKKNSQNSTANVDDSNNNELKKPYKCEECGWRFVAESTLIAHRVLHGDMHTCFCGIGFYQERDLNAHRRLIHPTKLTWKQETKYKGPKVLPEFAMKPEIESDSDSESDTAPKTSIRPRLKATLVTKKEANQNKLKVKIKNKRIIRNKENINGPPYQCGECDKFFQTLVIYRNHKRSHSVKIFKCPDCGKILSTNANLKIHILTHTGERPHQCEICNKRFTALTALNTHRKTVHENLKKHKCKTCGKGFNLHSQMKRHEVIHSNIRPYVCSYKMCEKGFSDQSALARHIRTHTGELRYFCPHCPAAFTDNSAYHSHVERKHLNQRYFCKICGKTLASKCNLSTHMRIQHGIGKEQYYDCDYCGKRFQSKSYLVVHIQSKHTKIPKERAWECNFCPKTFIRKDALNKHIRIVHLKKTAYQCDYCNLIFGYKNILINHIENNHIGTPMKYQCDYCQRRFPKKKMILKHIYLRHLHIKCNKCMQTFCTPIDLRKHKCFRCPECNELFGAKRKLSAHKRRVHFSKKAILNAVENSSTVPSS